MRIAKKALQNDNIDIEPFIQFIKGNFKTVFKYLKYTIKASRNTTELLEILSNFIIEEKETVEKFLLVLENNTIIFKYIASAIKADNISLTANVTKFILTKEKILKKLIKVFQQNYTLLKDFSELFKRKEKKDVTFINYLNFFLDNGQLTSIAWSAFVEYIKSQHSKSKSIDYIGFFIRKLFEILAKRSADIIRGNVTEECMQFANYTMLGNKDNENETDYDISYYYIYKLIQDSSKSKNNILKYDNCL